MTASGSMVYSHDVVRLDAPGLGKFNYHAQFLKPQRGEISQLRS
ncbi:hypothetical protein BH10BAC4_BH10BAC4_13490 [soil metagenome]